MQTFNYKAVTNSGKTVNGVIEAYNEYEAVSKLRETYQIITSIDEVKESNKTGTSLFNTNKIKDKELSVLCSQFSIILSSGLPIVKCVQMVANQTTNPKIKNVLIKVAEDISAGYSMAQSFEKNSKDFPPTFIETIRSGEQSGTLEKCFARLSKYFDKSAKTKAKITSTLIYPTLVIIVGIIVFVIIMVVAVPLFVKTFEELSSELPAITRALISISNFIRTKWWIILLIIMLIAVIYLIVRRSEEGKRFLAKFALTKAPLHTLTTLNAAKDYALTMATLLSAGMPINKALESTSKVVNNYLFSLGISEVKDKVEQGKSIGQAMSEFEYFPSMLVEMTSVGESSGSLEDTYEIVGDYFDNEVDVKTTRLLSMLEPAITIFIAIFAVILLLAVYLPMFSMYGLV